MKLATIASVLLATALTGCDIKPEPQTIELAPPQYMEQIDARFSVIRLQVFKDDLAYNNKRAVYLITDKKTQTEYVGVSGIGISELGSHSSGKSTKRDER